MHNKFGILGYFPGIFGLTGILILLKKNRKLAIALLLLFILTCITSILYFNLPENYMRPIYRHYMPSFTLFSVFIIYGIISIPDYFTILKGKYRITSLCIYTTIVIGVVFSQLSENYHKIDGSRNRLTYNYANGVLNSLEPNAILFSIGDNDFVPFVYMQVAENIRTDVTLCNLSILNTEWYARQIGSNDPTFPLKIADEEINRIPLMGGWKEQIAYIPVSAYPSLFMLPDTIPDTLLFRIPPTISNDSIRRQDVLLKEIIVNNKFERPIYFLNADPITMGWLQPYLRSDGLVFQLMPVINPSTNIEILRKNVLSYNYDGLDNPDISKATETQHRAYYSLLSLYWLAFEEIQLGNIEESASLIAKIKEKIPFEYYEMNKDLIDGIIKLEKYINDLDSEEKK